MQSTTYADAIREVYEGEVVAEGYFGELALSAKNDHQRKALTLIATIEGLTHGRLQSTADRLGIALSPAVRAERVEQALRGYRALSWQEFIARAFREWPAYIERFERLAGLAPAEDAKAVQFLVQHEQALVAFVSLEHGDDDAADSLALLRAFVKAAST